MYLWLLTLDTTEVGVIQIPCLTTQDCLTEIDDHIREATQYTLPIVLNVKALGATRNEPGLGLHLPSLHLRRKPCSEP